MKYGVLSALMSVAFIAPNVTLAQKDDTDLEHVLVEMANTPAEHQALFQHYTALAAEARDDVRRHEELAKTYAAGRSASPQMSNHCKRLAQSYGEIAAEYDELAKHHQQQAGGAPQR